MRVWKGLWMEGKLKSINCTKLPTLPFISVSEVMSCFNHSELEIQKLPRYQVNFYPAFRLWELTFVMVTIYFLFSSIIFQYFKGLKKRMLSCLTRKCWGMFTVHVTWTCLSTCYEKTSRRRQIWREIFTWNLSNICPDKNLHFKKIFSKFRENI